MRVNRLHRQRSCTIKIGDNDYQEIIIIGPGDEVLAVINDKKIIEKDGIRCVLKEVATEY